MILYLACCAIAWVLIVYMLIPMLGNPRVEKILTVIMVVIGILVLLGWVSAFWPVATTRPWPWRY